MHGILTDSMAQILYRHSLCKLNSFGVDVVAEKFTAPANLEDLEAVLETLLVGEDFLILGEGSNILFRDDFPGTIVRPLIEGLDVLKEDENTVVVKVGAGENWDNWVKTSLERGWSGLENLSLIPGSVGSSPVQNIGAYGVELKDHFLWLEAWDMLERKLVRLEKEKCKFAYRNSLFKSDAKGRYIITHVTFILNKTPTLNLSYGNIETLFQESGGADPHDLRDIIIAVRKSKLPDHKLKGNAGSFFKNPVIEASAFNALKERLGEVPSYPAPENKVKVPAAWLIDHAGWKGRRLGNVGTWPSQPLVIVNYGGATGQEIYDFSEKILEDINSKMGILLEREVNVI